MSNYIWRNNDVLWSFFIPQGSYYAQCNTCTRIFSFNRKFLEKHLLYEHQQEVMKKVLDNIDAAYLREYFTIDTDSAEIICVGDGCIINLFLGEYFLIDHLKNHHNIEIFVERSLRVQRNVASLRHRTSWHEAKSQGLAWIKHNLVWRYFTPIEIFTARCNICSGMYNVYCCTVQKFEDHLKNQHPEKIEKMLGEMQKEIKGVEILSHFIFDMEELQIRCTDCHINVNYFYGINNLRRHVDEHIINELAIIERINMEQLMEQQSKTEGSNASTNVNAQRQV